MKPEQRRRAKATIDRALENRDSDFRALVYELTVKNEWDIDDPMFLMLLASGEMQILLQQYPAQFEAVMNRVFAQAQAQFRTMLAEVLSAVDANQEGALAVEQRLSEVRQLLETERMAILIEHKALANQARETTAQQVQVLEAKATALTAQGFAVSRKQATEQVKVIAKQLRQVHYWETMFWACSVALMLVALSGLGGWQMRGLADQNSIWGDIQRWNRDGLKACLAVKKTTCNFHIQVPEA